MPDQREIGRIQGQQFARLLPNGGELLYIQGTFHTSAARMRLEGVREAISGLNVRKVMEQGDWSNASGAAAVQRWLQARVATAGSNCVVGAQNDDMAMGARAALVSAAHEMRQPELEEIPVTGCDGTVDQGRAWVKNKDLRATVVMPPTAAKAVDVLALAFGSGKIPTSDISVEEPVYSFPDLDLIGARDSTKSATRVLDARPRSLFMRDKTGREAG
jgi:ABC-type sugar transport system substrate-binding protein